MMKQKSIGWFSTVAAFGATACIPTLKSAFIDASYPEEVRQLPERQLTLSVDAAVVPALAVRFERPGAAGECLTQLSSDPEARRALWNYGTCRAAQGSEAACAEGLPWVRGEADPLRAASAGCVARLASAVDRVRMTVALAEVAESLVAYHESSSGQGAYGAPPPAELDTAFARTLAHAGALSSADPVTGHDARGAMLALSGGAANGAFTAGYLYGLLWMREKARQHADEAQRAAIDGYRFGGVAASSVGTLVGLPLDLYFSEGRPSASQARALAACIEGGGGPVSPDPGRLVQNCALARLEKNFVVNEWDLLCAQPGTVLSVLHDDFEGLLRFDPLEETIVAPFLSEYRSLLTNNQFVRTAMVVDMQQNVLVGLDERACRLPGMNADRCLVEAILASIIEPVFVPPRGRVYSGLEGPRGESGTWLDGSIRSLNPAARAAGFTAGKVLVVSTNRAEGVPSTPPAGALPLLLSTFDALGASQRAWEIGFASLYQAEREARFCEFGRLLENPSLCANRPELRATSPRGLATDRLLAVWVPEDVRPRVLFASGYTFDPLVMRGLFLWGQKEFFRSRARVLSWLDWCSLLTMEGTSEACAVVGRSEPFAREVRQRAASIEAELAQYAKYDDRDVWRKHLAARRKIVRERMKTCR